MNEAFKAYDIRGEYPKDINEDLAREVGEAFVHVLHKTHFVVGRDMRLSSDSLAEAFIDGAMQAGATITDIGCSTTPLLYYSIIAGNFDGGAMITASHLPAGMNGIKLCREQAIPLSNDSGLQTVARIVEQMASQPLMAAAGGSRQSGSYFDAYIDKLAGFIKEPRPLHLIVDAGNGMAGAEVEAICARMPDWHLIPMYFAPDGHFPHHVPNPLLPETTRDLQAQVTREHADIGIAFDGDADRIGFVDEQGRRIREDFITALLAEYYLPDHPGAGILYDLRSSQIVPDTITQWHGRAIRSRVGHSFMVEEMHAQHALFGGELSGHYYYQEIGSFDDAMLTMVLVLNVLAEKQQPISAIMQPFARYCDSGEINFTVQDRQAVLHAIQQRYADMRQDQLDGLTVRGDDWWFNLRLSHTEPLIRLNLEANDCREMHKRLDELTQAIHQAEPGVKRAA